MFANFDLKKSRDLALVTLGGDEFQGRIPDGKKSFECVRSSIRDMQSMLMAYNISNKGSGGVEYGMATW